MVTKRRVSASSVKYRDALYGILIGILLGLAAAAVAAFYITQESSLFVKIDNRALRQDSTPLARLARPNLALPDSNSSLPMRSNTASTAPGRPTPPSPLRSMVSQSVPTKWSCGKLEDLIVRLPEMLWPNQPTPNVEPTKTNVNHPITLITGNSANIKTATKGAYLLQAGAFFQNKDAESLQARIILLDLPVNVQLAEFNGSLIYRVRVGPFVKLDDMNCARTRLDKNKIEFVVTHE